VHLNPRHHAEFYCSSRMTLNVTRREMVIAGYSPSVRLFEAAACAATIVSDNWPGLEVFFTPGKEILVPAGGDDVARYISDYDAQELGRLGRAARERVIADRLYAQRCVHETLRLRPTTPKIKRRAEADTIVAGVAIPRDALVVLDAATANRDPRLFGPDPDAFDPDRVLDPGVSRWGLSFGAGPHQCPGRSVAGGFPVPVDGSYDDDHLFGLVALMVQALAARGVRPDPEHSPTRDTRTERHTRWASYPVRFGTG